MDLADLLLRAPIWVALGLYVLVLAAWIVRPRSRVHVRALRWAWTCGCLFGLLHTVCAFHIVHGWSHTAALEATARQTQQLIGFPFELGLYWNYAFLILWASDTAWWWISLNHYVNRPPWIGRAVFGFLGFMAFQGAIVFAAGWIRWVGVAACLGLVLLWWTCRPTASAQAASAERSKGNDGSDPAINT